MSDFVFEINPEQYLYKSDEGKCYFVIHKGKVLVYKQLGANFDNREVVIHQQSKVKFNKK